MSEQYPKSKGAVWPNDHKTEAKHPDWRGRIKITKEQINKLIEMAKAGQEPTLQVGAWKRRSEAGQNYIYLSAEVYMKPEEDGSAGWGNDDSDDDWGTQKPAKSSNTADAGFDDDDIPF